MSALTVAVRLIDEGFTTKTLHCWGAMSFIVCMGAPVGSLVLTPRAVPYLRGLFYFLAVTQFVLFGILKIKADVEVWLATAVLTGVVGAILWVDHLRGRKATDKP